MMRSFQLPKMSPAFVKANLSGHSILSLIFSAMIYIICVTGAIIMLERQSESWERPYLPYTSEVSHEVMATFAKNLEEQLGETPTGITMALPNLERGPFFGGAESERTTTGAWIGDPNTGELIEERSREFTNFIYQLHVRFHIPASFSTYAGKYLVGFIGVVLLAIILTGVLSHPRIFKEAFMLRWGGSRRLQEVDIHNRLAVWGLPFHLAVTLTGIFLGIASAFAMFFAIAFYDGDFEAASNAIEPEYVNVQLDPAPLPDIKNVMATFAANFPDDIPTYLVISEAGTEGQRVIVNTFVPGQLTFAEEHVFSGEGEYIETAGYARGDAGLQTAGAIVLLHFGQFAGLFGRLVYFFLGIALCVVICGGMRIWFIRNADRGKHYPKSEKLWAATVWGLLIAFNGAAFFNMHFGLAPIYAWLVLSLIFYIAALFIENAAKARNIYRMIFAGSCFFLVVTQIAKFGFEQDWNAHFYNFILVATGTLIFAACSAARRKSVNTAVASQGEA